VSPDGSRIAFIGSLAENEIWLMGVNGEQPRKLLEAAAGQRFLQLQWSPNGQRIAFLKASADRVQTSIESQPIAGGLSVTVLSRPGVRSFCWLPDNRMVFSLDEPPPNDRDMNLWQLPVDQRSGQTSGEPERLTGWAGLSLLDLSATADGKHLVFVNSGFQTDVYISEVGQRGVLTEPQRLTFDERNDVPSAWSPDSQSVYFWSDRSGNWDIFRQHWHSRTPEEVVLGPGEQTEPRLSPDGSWLLYWDFVQKGGVIAGPMRLLRVPVSGGSPETVLEARPGAAFRCAVSRLLCILSERDEANHEIVFYGFTVLGGRIGESVPVAADAGASPSWDLSPDGSMLAIDGLNARKDHIRILEWESGSSRAVTLGLGQSAAGLAWTPDGRALLVATSSVRHFSIVRLHLDGDSDVLWTGPDAVNQPIMSPDQKKIAFSLAMHSSNAWLIENF
jgi:Tol biopolymer transport system component